MSVCTQLPSECPHTLLSHHALCSPHSALASLSSAGSAPSRSQLHLLHPPSSQFCAIPCQSSQEALSSFPNPLPGFLSARFSPSSSEPACHHQLSAWTSRGPQPSVFEGRCHSPPAREQLPPLSVTTSPGQDALSRVESKTSLCPLKWVKGSASHTVSHLSFWTCTCRDSLPRNLISTLCLSNLHQPQTLSSTSPPSRKPSLLSRLSQGPPFWGALSCSQLPPSAHSGY